MKDKEKQLVNEIKQDFKMHEEKHKQIEEMAKAICSHCLEMTEEKVCPYAKTEDELGNEACFTERLHEAEKVYNAGYRKLPEDSVVLSKGAYESLSSKAKANVVNAVEIRKATAKNFLNMIYWKAVKHMKGENKDECFIEMSFEKLDELAKQFGVDIKE